VSACDQFRELYEAYALGSLDREERADFETHLATNCPACARAVEQARGLVAQLAYLAPEASPSAAVKRRILDSVRASKVSAAAPARFLPAWAWAGIAALLVATVVSTWQARREAAELRKLHEQFAALEKERRELVERIDQARRTEAILLDPASRQVALATRTPDLPGVRAYWSDKLGIVLTGAKVPAPQGNRTLQLWLVPKGPGAKPISAGIFRPDAQGNLTLLVADPPAAMAATAALAISDEPEGGSPQPTTTPIWVGAVT
jgi:anti-sigma-K factor RskA